MCNVEAKHFFFFFFITASHLLYNLQQLFPTLIFFVFQVLYAEECQVGARRDTRPHRKVSGTPPHPPSKKKISLLHLFSLYDPSLSGRPSLEIISRFSSHLCLVSPLSVVFPSCRYCIILCFCFSASQPKRRQFGRFKAADFFNKPAGVKRLSTQHHLLLGTRAQLLAIDINVSFRVLVIFIKPCRGMDFFFQFPVWVCVRERIK